MTLNEYQNEAMRTASGVTAASDENLMLNGAMGLNGAPDSGNKYVLESVEASDLNIKDPVALDLRTGAVYNLESSRSDEGLLTLRRVPVYDSPVFVIDRSLLALQAQSK